MRQATGLIPPGGDFDSDNPPLGRAAVSKWSFPPVFLASEPTAARSAAVSNFAVNHYPIETY